MNESKSIKNVVVFDGTKEYQREEIKADVKLNQLVDNVTAFGGFASIIDEINKENGLLYITTDQAGDFGSGELKNVSSDLYETFRKRRP